MTLADRTSTRARRTARSSAKPGSESRSSRSESSIEQLNRATSRDSTTSHLAPDELRRFTSLIRKFGEFLFEINRNGTFLTAWASRNALLQKSRTSVFSKRPREVFGYQVSQVLDHIFKSVIHEQRRVDAELALDLPAGRRWFHVLGYPVSGTAKRAYSVCLMARDISARKTAEFSLRQREALLAHAEQVTQTGCWELDVKTGRRDWSLQLFKLYGLDPAQGVPAIDTMFGMIDAADRERVRAVFDSAIRDGTPFQSEAPYHFPDGRVRIIFVRGLPLLDETGKTAQLVGVVQDVTELRERAEKQRRSESLLSQAEQLANLGSWEFDVTEQSFTWSAEMFRMLGIEPQEEPVPLGRACALFHSDDRLRVWQEVRTLLQDKQPLENEVRFVLSDGRVRIFQSRAVCIADQAGRALRILGTSQDVTEQKLAEAKLRNSERLLAQAEEIAGLGSWEFDATARTVICSQECFRLLHWEPMPGPIPIEQIWSLLHLEDLDAAKRALQHTVATNTLLEHVSRYIMPDASIRVFHTRAIPFADSSGRVTRVVGFNHDITEQTRIEDDLRRLSRQLLTLRTEEQRRVARELHETASQTLTALKMTLRQIGDLLPGSETRGQELLRSASVLAGNAIREVRTISSILHPPVMDEVGLASGLRAYAKLFAERSSLAVELNIPENLPRLPKEIELTIFCVVQEALANVHRHAKARATTISIAHSPAHVAVQIADNGLGMAIPAHKQSGDPLLGIGISGMRERVKQLGGEFHIESSLGSGTEIQVVLPLSGKEGTQ